MLEPFQFPSLTGSPSAFYTLDPSSCQTFFTPCHKSIPYPKGSPLSQGHPLFQGFTLFKRISLIPWAHPYQKDIPYPKGSPLSHYIPYRKDFPYSKGSPLSQGFRFSQGLSKKALSSNRKGCKEQVWQQLESVLPYVQPFYLHQNTPKVKHLNNSTYISLNFKTQLSNARPSR